MVKLNLLRGRVLSIESSSDFLTNADIQFSGSLLCNGVNLKFWHFQKISQLLDRLVQMNEILMARHKALAAKLVE